MTEDPNVPPAGDAPGAPTQDERNMAMLAHLLAIVLGFLGVLVGLGIGDALGKPIQKLPWDVIEKRHGYVNRYLSAPIEQFILPPGQITDDTQQALIIADSITMAMMTMVSMVSPRARETMASVRAFIMASRASSVARGRPSGGVCPALGTGALIRTESEGSLDVNEKTSQFSRGKRGGSIALDYGGVRVGFRPG